jgi:site-specific recombinase XerD
MRRTNIRNRNTREAYGRAVRTFLAWCETQSVVSLVDVESLHIATWIEAQTLEASVPTVKQRLAAIRHLFDWLVVGQTVPVKAASMANHASTRTTRLYDRRDDQFTIDEVERVGI